MERAAKLIRRYNDRVAAGSKYSSAVFTKNAQRKLRKAIKSMSQEERAAFYGRLRGR